ncbi:hypothetical protein [Pseudaminobacter soli (ex Li et al. 2025)]|uniref:Uncharacterized protein n=1 Tax=Pseudaminobacter soli (ex Li et al. 2025) TaxID=1295366 RepID=A0A2P7SHT9_9HYPH|nr:hypothetical protein [Mesorhizobium soli]PSJ62054.1 hypothetical protein C7I85_06900 [Mesorhizobium soli]
MGAQVEPIDLVELLKTGRSGPIELGKSGRQVVRDLIDPDDLRADNHYVHHDVDSPWCIYGENCEFFFSPDFLLRHIKIIPHLPTFGLGGLMMTWNGGLDLRIGRHPATFAGSEPIEIHTLPRALRFFHEAGLTGPMGGGQERDISVRLLNGSREVELRYELQTLPVSGERNVVFEIDYFLAAVWIVDNNIPG